MQIGLRGLSTYARIKGADAEMVGPDTDIVVEGYPRSANTTAVAAIRVANRRGIRIAHHIHAPMQFRLAARYGVPAMLLIREPSAAIASLSVRERGVNLEKAFRDYCCFYEQVRSVRNSFVIGEFEAVLWNFSMIVAEVNKKFGTSIEAPINAPAEDSAVRNVVEDMDRADRGAEMVDETSVGRPNAARARLSERIFDRIDAEVPSELVSRAVEIYEDYRSHAAQLGLWSKAREAPRMRGRGPDIHRAI
jgi:hypothetical protein